MATFKQIQLVGFKSFADKTVIPLDDGVTCIVGPNGCGKSNVADAIRWVLGEQSAKMMRGSQMMDVIFNGTESRRPMSYCEVTLTFDNTSRVFDIDSDEVEMTRRLYRDGESEYLLNRQPSRMKVLTGLLHGAGAAKEGYSIIGQGRIDQIMNSKPEDRRAIFEEATGVTMFRDRKAEVERKLKYSKDNLYISMQGVREIERTMEALESEREKELKYRELYIQRRDMEINLYIYRHDTIAVERANIDEKSEALNNQLAENEETAARYEEEYVSGRKQIKEIDAEIEELFEKRSRYEVGTEKRRGESNLFAEKARSVKEKLAAAQEEVVYSTQRLSEINLNMRRMENLANVNREKLAAMQSEGAALQADLKALNAKIAEYEYKTGEHRKKVVAAFKELAEMSQNLGSLEAQKQFLTERMEEVRGDLNAALDRRDRISAEYGQCVARSNELSRLLGNENELLEQAEKNNSDCAENVERLVKQCYDIREQISGLENRLKVQLAVRERLEGYSGAVKRLLTEARADLELTGRIEGMIADFVSTSSEYEVAIETAFGGAMQNVITPTREDAKRLIEYLKRMRAGQVTFLPLDALRPRLETDQIKTAVHENGAVDFAINLVKYDKKYDNVIRFLLGNTLVCEDIACATRISRRYARAFKIVTLDGDVINTSGTMTGGSRKEQVGNLLAAERTIKELEEGVSGKRGYLAKTEEKLKTAREQSEMAAQEKQALYERLQNARLELAAVSEKQSSLMQQVSSAESDCAACSQSITEFKERIALLDNAYSGASKGASDLSAQSDMASSAIDDINAEFESIKAERDEKAEKLNSINVQTASLEAVIKSNDENLQRMDGERKDIETKLAATRESIPEIQREMESFTMQAQLAALSPEEREAVEKINGEIEQKKNLKKDIEAVVTENEAVRSRLGKEREDCISKISDLNVLRERVENNLTFLQQRIEEEYNETTYEGCLKYKDENFDPRGKGEEIERLKRRMQALNVVNHAAVEQYDEAKARYDKKIAEKEDMEKAVSDLEKALDDVRTDILSQFNEGFNIIAENFKRTFKELFGGGKAELALDYSECEDPLDAGVEIKACPPGKTLTKISLLSGGERALTAIAILFAIIGMRPMPFCVLDEIEAALDEANVLRYAKYLKKFARNTQFIVITHRKPTMENADILFGVTMEEKGVSKIVSVKLSEVESKLGGDTVQ